MTDQTTETIEETTVSEPVTQQVTHKTQVVKPPTGTTPAREDYEAKKVIFRAYQVIWYILGVLEVLLVFRFLLLLFGANTQSGFASLVYSITYPFVVPFSGIFKVVRTSTSVFEWATVLAIVVYPIIAYAIIALFQLVKPTTPAEVEGTVDNV